MIKENNISVWFLLLIFLGCSFDQKKENISKENKSVCTFYNAINIDSSSIDTAISMYNEDYNLKISKYCLNDSAVVNEGFAKCNDERIKTAKRISHNYSFNVTLTNGDKEILNSQIIKSTFKDSLGIDFDNLIVSDIYYHYVRTNRIYFTAIAKKKLPYSDIIYQLDFAIFYKTNKIGQLDYWGFKKIND